RDPEQLMVLSRQAQPDPFAEARTRSAQVDDDVEHFAGDDAHELSLRLLDLVVQAAENSARRARMIVLHEVDVDAGRVAESATVVALEEEAARIAEDFRLQQHDFGQRGGGCLERHDQNTLSRSRLRRYSP